MKKNKLILFDWGNIVECHLTGYTLYDAFYDLFKELGYKNRKIIQEINKYNYTNTKTITELETKFYELKEHLNLKGDFPNFVNRYNYYCDKISYYKDVRDYEISLKDKCYIGILSNLDYLAKRRLNNQVGLDNYDYVFLSFELECNKPNPLIYKKVEEQIPFRNKDILFIDDSLKNIEMAKTFGWQTLQATGLELEKIKETCENFLKN